VTKADLAGTRVLVVDDEADTRELVESLLSIYGADVTTAASGNEAFAMFEREPPHLVVSDIQMPDGTGLDLIRQIRSLPRDAGATTPAIAVSGAALLDESLDAGFHFHFMKPLRANMLVDAIRSFVKSEERDPRAWTLDVRGDEVCIRWYGVGTSADMKAMTEALAAVVRDVDDGRRITLDLRHLNYFTPSVGAAAQAALWDVRGRLRDVTVIGGSQIARAITRSTCSMMGVAYTCSDEPPALA